MEVLLVVYRYSQLYCTKMQRNHTLQKLTFQSTYRMAPQAGPQREIFPGGTKIDTGPPNLIGPPKRYRGPCSKIIFRPGTKLAQIFFFDFLPKIR